MEEYGLEQLHNSSITWEGNTTEPGLMQDVDQYISMTRPINLRVSLMSNAHLHAYLETRVPYLDIPYTYHTSLKFIQTEFRESEIQIISVKRCTPNNICAYSFALFDISEKVHVEVRQLLALCKEPSDINY